MELNIVEIVSQTMYVILLLSMPPLLVSLIVGLLISIFQASTQIQDASLSFIPKLVIVFITLLLMMSWAMEVLTDFTNEMWGQISTMTKAK